MKRLAKVISISFPTAEEAKEAQDKCKERGEGFSEHIQKHFKNLRRRSSPSQK